MVWEKRHGELYYYRKVREGVRLRSIYFGKGERADIAAREDNCPSLVSIVEQEESALTLACATPDTDEFDEVRHKKEAERWPPFLEVLRARRDYGALLLLYPVHTLPAQGESLADWHACRVAAHEAGLKV